MALPGTLTVKVTGAEPFTNADVGKTVSIHGDDDVKVDGVPRVVPWGNAKHLDCTGKIKSVEEKYKGKVQLEDGKTFENIAAEDKLIAKLTDDWLSKGVRKDWRIQVKTTPAGIFEAIVAEDPTAPKLITTVTPNKLIPGKVEFRIVGPIPAAGMLSGSAVVMDCVIPPAVRSDGKPIDSLIREKYETGDTKKCDVTSLRQVRGFKFDSLHAR